MHVVAGTGSESVQGARNRGRRAGAEAGAESWRAGHQHSAYCETLRKTMIFGVMIAQRNNLRF